MKESKKGGKGDDKKKTCLKWFHSINTVLVQTFRYSLSLGHVTKRFHQTQKRSKQTSKGNRNYY